MREISIIKADNGYIVEESDEYGDRLRQSVFNRAARTGNFVKKLLLAAEKAAPGAQNEDAPAAG